MPEKSFTVEKRGFRIQQESLWPKNHSGCFKKEQLFWGYQHHAQHSGDAGNGLRSLSFCAGGKMIPAQGKAILFLSFSFMQELNVKPYIFKIE